MKSHRSHMPRMPTKDTLAVRDLLFMALGAARQGYIMVEIFWSRFPGLIQTKYKVSASIWAVTWKWKGGIQPPLFGQSTEQHDTVMRGVLLLLAVLLVGTWSGVTPGNTRLWLSQFMWWLVIFPKTWKKISDWHNKTSIRCIGVTWNRCRKHYVSFWIKRDVWYITVEDMMEVSNSVLRHDLNPNVLLKIEKFKYYCYTAACICEECFHN